MNNFRKIIILQIFLLSFNVFAGLIKTGDVLEIHVGGHTELSKKVMVKSDGTVDYPFLEDRILNGMTTTELSDLLIYRLAKNIESPFVIVSKIESMPIFIRLHPVPLSAFSISLSTVPTLALTSNVLLFNFSGYRLQNSKSHFLFRVKMSSSTT